MVVISIVRSKGQDGKPTNPNLIKALNEHKDLSKIPHRFFFPKNILKNLLIVKKAVLKNKETYIKSGGGNKMTSAVIIIDGKSDAGKSTLASQVGLFFDPYMTLEKNYAWNFKKLFRLIEHVKPGGAIIFDEAMIANSRGANSEDNKKLIVALSQIRSKGAFLIFCINSVHQLEKSIPLSRANFLIHVKRIGGINGTPKYVAYDSDRMKDLVIKNAGKYSYKGVLPNTNWATFSRYFFACEVKYDKMKHKESMENINGKKKSIRDDKIKIGIAKLIEHCKKENFLSFQQCSKVIGIPTSTMETYRALAKEKEDG